MKMTLEFATIGCVILLGLMAGFFYAYSVDVMIALDRLSPQAAIESMQSINLVVRNPMFFVTFFLTPVACFVTGAFLWAGKNRTTAGFVIGAGAFYLVFAWLPTIAINVPMNEALALVSGADIAKDAANIWQNYSPTWTFWNTLRTIASALATGIAGFGLLKYSD